MTLQKTRQALERSATTFRSYEVLHLAKDTNDATVKAKHNASKAFECEDALTELNPYIARLESSGLVMDMVIQHNMVIADTRNAHKAMQAAINVIKGL